MKQFRHICYWFVATLILISAVDASAVTLGRAHGVVVVVGRPLELLVTVEFAADEDATPDIRAMCYSADVLFGDSQVASRNVQMQVTAGATPQIHTVRISTTSLVDEPTVSINLQVGCIRKTTRRYVLLAEMLSELAPDAPVTAASSVASAAVAARQPAPATEVAVQSDSKPKVRKHRSGSNGSQLKLSGVPLDAAQAHSSTKASRKAEALAMEELQKRVDALDQWKMTMPAAAESAQIQARVQAFEGDLKGLHALTLKNQQSLQLVAADLERVQSGARDGNLLLYALSGVLALCVAVVAWLVFRVRNAYGDASPWWSAQAKEPKLAEPVQPEAIPRDMSALATYPLTAHGGESRPVSADATGKSDVDIDIGLGADGFVAMGTKPVSADRSGFRHSEKQDFSLSSVTTLRSVNTKEMLDVRQQAEFFMALGQHDEAVKLLEGSINQSQEANPLVILDLLKIFHSLGRRSEFDHYRQEFNQQFTGQVQGYSNFMQEGHGLDTYEEICQEIAALWPTDDAMDYIEQCLVRTEEDDPDQGFDLEAFRDLLMLHGVLKRLGSSYDADLTPFSTTRNLNAPVSVPDTFVETPISERTQEYAPTATADPHAGVGSVDLDLTEPSSDDLIDFDISSFTLDAPIKPAAK
jgi:hypothetical protein